MIPGKLYRTKKIGFQLFPTTGTKPTARVRIPPGTILMMVFSEMEPLRCKFQRVEFLTLQGKVLFANFSSDPSEYMEQIQ